MLTILSIFGLTALYSASFGEWTVRALGLESSAPGDLSFRVGVGFASAGTLHVLLLLAGLFSLPVLLATLILAVLASCVRRMRTERRTEPLTLPSAGAAPSTWWIRIVLALMAAGLALLALYPIQGYDFRTYQYPMAHGYAQAGAWVWFDALRFPTFPPLMNLWFSFADLLGNRWGWSAAQLVALLPLWPLCALLLSFSRELGVTRPVAAVTIFLGSPIVVWTSSHGYVDIGVALFTTLSIYGLHRFAQQIEAQPIPMPTAQSRPRTQPTRTNDHPLRERDGASRSTLATAPHHAGSRWLIFSGLTLGAAMNSKYTAALLAVFIALWVPAAWWKAREREDLPQRDRHWLTPLRWLTSSLGTAALVSSPWYLKTWITTGNPVFPFAKSIFGPSPWGWRFETPLSLPERFLSDLERLEPRWDSISPWLLLAMAILAWVLMRGVIRWTRRLLRRRTHRGPGHNGRPLAMENASIRSQDTSRSLLIGATALYLALWRSLSNDSRYALPALALLAILAAHWYSALMARVDVSAARTEGPWWKLIACSPLGHHPLFISLGVAFVGHHLMDRGPLPLSEERREEFAQRWFPPLAAFRWVEQREPQGTYYQYRLSDLTGYVPEARILGGGLGPYSYRALLERVESADRLAAGLRDLGVDYVLENRCGDMFSHIVRNHQGSAESTRRLAQELPLVFTEVHRTPGFLPDKERRAPLDRGVEEVCIYRLWS